MIRCAHIDSRRLWKTEQGITSLEFALIAPVLTLFVLGILEIGILFFAAMTIESAMTNTSRLGKTGFTAAGVSRQQTIMNMLSQYAGSLINMSNVTITTTVYPNFDSIGDAEPYQDTNGNNIRDAGESYTDINGNGQWDADMGVQGLGNANDVVLYTVTYPWPIITPIMKNFLGTNGTYTITSRTVVKNEPY